MIDQFFWQKINKHDTFSYIWIILLQITFFGNRLTKSDFLKNLRRCHYIYAYWLQFKVFFEIVLLVKSKFT